MCETMKSSHLLSDVLGVEVFFLAPTASGDGAGARFCAPLPPSPPPFRGMAENTQASSGKPFLPPFWWV